MWQMILPIALVVISNCFYNIVTKKTPENANAFLSLAVTYAVASVMSFVFFFIGNHSAVSEEIKKLNWTSLALGVVIIGLEFGYILAYRAGWNVSKAPLVANCVLAIALVFIGAILFREQITFRHIIGIAICIAGLVVVTV